MIKHYLRTVFLVFFLMSVSLYSQVIAPFASIYQTNQRGGIVFLSNSALGCSANPPVSTGTCQLGALETPLLGTTRNDDYSSVFIDIDNDLTTFMSSSDSLNLPACSRITKAFLFWGASGNNSTNLNQVKLKINGGIYQTVIATSSLSNSTGFNSYHCYADVTSLISGSGTNARITVANIPSSQVGSVNTFGSWNLVIVYKNDAMNVRQLTVFNGLANLSAASPTINIPLSGFLTPTTGAVSFEIGAYSHDGDRGITGDNILFNGNLTFLPMVDLTTNPASDVMNSTVSNNGISNPFRKPLLNNTMGSDADIYVPINLLNTYLTNAATTATIQLLTTTDNYLTQALTSSIDSYEPDLRATVKAKDVNGGSLNPGDVIQYRVTGFNTGSDFSNNTVIVDTLDANVNYIPNSTSVVFGPNSGSKTDLSGDDQVDYNALTRILKIRIGNGANAAGGGSVAASPTGLDSTVVTYSVIVSQSCLKLSCNNSIKARAYISGIGSVFSHTLVNASTPGTTDIFGCGIAGVTTSTVSLGTCATPTAVNSSPACSGGSVSLSASFDPEAIYTWSGPGSYNGTGRNQTLTAITATNSGTYTVTLSIPSSTCMATANTAVTVQSCPPTAVNDFTTTLVNTTVSANASLNDINASPNGTFAITVQPTNGTVSINPTTGVYTFTPAAGFSGITTATYQLCNSLPVVCSQASITFTVYPNLVANPDLINTIPLTTTTGSLLSNDTGITAGANYTVTVTQPLPTTGTITINPATGQYTFIPNTLFTGTVQTTYTVCNTSINPQQCSSATITIIVSNLPIAVNDATATVINIPVSGNVGTNDSGTFGGTFTFGTLTSGTGTLITNSSGQYTFTPATGFTGTSSVSYTLCNLLSPPCSTASITFTVYPNVLANPDVINTAPLITATGSLLNNDGGITPGANYSVTITPPSSTSGTLIVNSSTGQYTFIPNPLFTGTAQATYTVCNISVNPQQCSSTSITIIISNAPVAINDFTATMINNPVSGNAGANDSGTLLANFSFGNLTAGTGTLTGNALTGQYTYSPAPGFTGTTSATYTLCNLSSPPCSTATITFTVFATLVAVNDQINTTPSVTANGSLLANDIGISSSASYTVTITQLPSTTGTLIVNSTTGSYTFIPNPSFTGLTQTTYTVCNTSVTPQQCSNATINIAVGNFALAVNDDTVTLQNTTVSGDVSLNDLNGSGGTYTFANPTSGTLTTNAAGQYTYMPATGFTGTLSVSYTLCTSIPPCSSAQLTFTVYPLLLANPDIIFTSVNNAVTGDLTSNDIGIVAGGIYSVNVAPISTSFGSLTVNGSSGQYTFTPFPGFTGSTTTSYTLSQFTGTLQLQSSVTTITLIIAVPGSAVGIAKSITTINYKNNSTVELTYKLVIKNYSNQTVTNVSVQDDLSATFPAPTTYTVIYPPTLTIPLGSQLVANSNYSGTGTNTQLLTTGGSLAPGRTDELMFMVALDPHNAQLTYSNTAIVSGVLPDSTYTDFSVDGLDPDPDHNGNPGDNASPTILSFDLIKIGIAKSASRSQSLGNALFQVTFKFTVKNYGAAIIHNVSVFDNLDQTFGSASNYTVVGGVASANGILVPDVSYNGSSNTNLLLPASQLPVNSTDTLRLLVKYRADQFITFSNTSLARGNSLNNGGFIANDVSTNGLDPDLNNNGYASDVGEDLPTLFMPSEDFQIPQAFSPNGDGINDVFEIKGIQEFPNIEVSILNRWGNLVYSKKQYDNTWNGKCNEGLQYGGNDLPEGTYFYIIDLGTDQQPMKGFVYLNRAVK